MIQLPELTLAEHPGLLLGSFVSMFPRPLGELGSPDWLAGLLSADSPAPLSRHEPLRLAVRDMLRHGGYKPTGRGKPASEYLLRTAAEPDGISRINPAVDCCNVASLHSGLPISVVDLDLAHEPLRVAIAAPGSRYVFNPAGQEIDVSGLLCLHDALGPCANAVKDAQRTKTHAGTRRTLSLVWGCEGWSEQLEAAVAWYRQLLERAGAETRGLTPTP